MFVSWVILDHVKLIINHHRSHLAFLGLWFLLSSKPATACLPLVFFLPNSSFLDSNSLISLFHMWAVLVSFPFAMMKYPD